jgi:HSP90 family molecular chaperone
MNDLRRTNNGRKTHLPARVHTNRPPIEWPVRDTNATDNERAAAFARQQVDHTYQQQADAPPQTENGSEQSYDLNQYHNAWQQYYHQYYYRYYANWYQQSQREKQQTANAPENVSTEPDHQKATEELREKVKQRVRDRSKKVKASHHFKPIVAALSVGILFFSHQLQSGSSWSN